MAHFPSVTYGRGTKWPKKDKPGDLVQGTLDMLVLRALADGAKHGYAVAEWIHDTSQDVLRVEEGALYPGAPSS